MRLTIYDIIDNMIDELSRTREILLYSLETKNSMQTENSMLLSDIESSLERASDLKDRIEFALIIATYAGMENSQIDFEHECENSEWRDKYMQAASDIEFEYEDGAISSEWAYDTACDIARRMIKG